MRVRAPVRACPSKAQIIRSAAWCEGVVAGYGKGMVPGVGELDRLQVERQELDVRPLLRGGHLRDYQTLEGAPREARQPPTFAGDDDHLGHLAPLLEELVDAAIDILGEERNDRLRGVVHDALREAHDRAG
jgi:hypothetical protein